MNHVEIINEVMKNREIKRVIDQRLLEFSSFKNKNCIEWFSELCFCLLTANASAAGGMKVQAEVSPKEFLELSQEKLAEKLKKIGYRFPNVRSKYIVGARKFQNIKELIQKMSSQEAREFLVKNVKGLGMKEASHFLRNTGRLDVGILDKHIMRSLGYEVKSMNPQRYEKVEKDLIKLARKTGTNLAELDLILWWKQTGTVLK